MIHRVLTKKYSGRNKYGDTESNNVVAPGSLFSPYSVGSSSVTEVEDPITLKLTKTSNEFLLASEAQDISYIFAFQDSELIPTYICDVIDSNSDDPDYDDGAHFCCYIENNGYVGSYMRVVSDGTWSKSGLLSVNSYFVAPDYDQSEDSYTYYGQRETAFYYYDFIENVNTNEYNLILDNEFCGLAADSSGNIVQQSWNWPSITAALYQNGYPVSSGDCEYSLTFSSVSATGISIGLYSGEIMFSSPVSFNNDTLQVTVSASVDNTVVASKIISVNKVKSGSDGTMTRRWLELSSNCVVIDNNTSPVTIQPSTITAVGYYQINDGAVNIDSSSTISYYYDLDTTNKQNYSGAVIVNKAKDLLTFEMVNNNTIVDKQDVAIMKQGVDGSAVDGLNNVTVKLYKRAASASINWNYDCVWRFSSKQLSPIPTGWSMIPPANDSDGDPVWVTAAIASSRTDTDVIEYTEWASPVKYVENGINTAQVSLYKRSATALTRNDLPSDDYFYYFASGILEDPQQGTVPSDYGGWTRDIPSGSNDVYYTMAVALGTGEGDMIEGGSTGDWSTPMKVFGNGAQGLKGAALRGPYDWFSELDARRWCNGNLTSSLYPEDASFIDVVYISTEDKYYVCKVSYSQQQAASHSAADWAAVKDLYWQEADGDFDFVVANVLLANNGKIKFFGTNELYLMDGNTVTAGAKGCSSSSPVAFWAGADGTTTPISSAPFQVSYDGHLKATNADITGKIIAYGVAYTDVQTGDYSIEARNGIYNEGKFFAKTGIAQSGGLYYPEGVFINENTGTVLLGATDEILMRSLSNEITVQRGSNNAVKEKLVSSVPNTVDGVSYAPYNIMVVSSLPAQPSNDVIYLVV